MIPTLQYTRWREGGEEEGGERGEVVRVCGVVSEGRGRLGRRV